MHITYYIHLVPTPNFGFSSFPSTHTHTHTHSLQHNETDDSCTHRYALHIVCVKKYDASPATTYIMDVHVMNTKRAFDRGPWDGKLIILGLHCTVYYVTV